MDWTQVAVKAITGAIIAGLIALFVALMRRKKEG
jgi:hypothetical protein